MREYCADFNMVKAYSRPRTNEEKSYVKPEWRHLAFGGESRSGTKICWTAWSVWVRVPPVLHEIEVWCNGSTTDFGSVSPGSNPGTSTKLNREVHSNFMQYTINSFLRVSQNLMRKAIGGNSTFHRAPQRREIGSVEPESKPTSFRFSTKFLVNTCFL